MDINTSYNILKIVVEHHLAGKDKSERIFESCKHTTKKTKDNTSEREIEEETMQQ